MAVRKAPKASSGAAATTHGAGDTGGKSSAAEPYDEKLVANKMNAAKLLAAEKRPYLRAGLFALIPVCSPGLGTFGTDFKWRMYYDPKLVELWSANHIAGVINHELEHCIRNHAARFRATGDALGLHKVWNIAGDLLINEGLRSEGIELPTDPIQPVFKDNLNENWGVEVDTDMSTEAIYHVLREKALEQQENQQNENSEDNEEGEGKGNGGSGSNSGENENQENGQGGQSNGDAENGQSGQSNGAGKPNGDSGDEETPSGGWDCGSAADGVPREYEQQGDAVDPGLDSERTDIIRRQVAKDIQDHVKTVGNVPGEWERWADELLEPVIDWRSLLQAKVRRSATRKAGVRDYSYYRRSRRQKAVSAAMGRQVRIPGMVSLPPIKVAFVLDTSGSMSGKDLAEMMTEIEAVLHLSGVHRDSVTIRTCDMVAGEPQIVRTVKDLSLAGGGGTDMTIGIEAAMKDRRNKPDLVIVATDGYTPYPTEPLGTADLVVVVTENGNASGAPEWASVVQRNDSKVAKNRAA